MQAGELRGIDRGLGITRSSKYAQTPEKTLEWGGHAGLTDQGRNEVGIQA